MIAAVVSTAIFSGCETTPRTDAARTGPFFTPTNVRGVDRLPATLRRVAVLPAAGLSSIPEESLTRLDQALIGELNRTARAEAVPVSRDVLARLSGARQLEATEALPHDLLSKLRTYTQADAVLFTDITTYSPYPPLALGLRARLVDLTSGEILWAFDNLFDTTHPAVVNAARRHYLNTSPAAPGSADLSSTVLQNPTRFGAYVGAAMFSTLPPR